MASPAPSTAPDVRTPEFLDEHARSVLSFYYPACIDERGGYHQYFHPDGTPDRANTQRHLVASTRLTINFAVAARHYDEPGLLEAARHGVAFLRAAHRNPATGGYAWIIDGERLIDGDNQAYGIAFVLMAYARACQAGMSEARPFIAETFDFLERHFWEDAHSLYAETRSADLQQLAAYRGQNANMHCCEAMIAAFEATGERRYLERAGRIAHQLTVRLAERTQGRIWEHYDARWQQDFDYNKGDPSNKLRPWGYQPGHFTEWAKLLLQIHRHAPQDWLVARAKSLFDDAMAMGLDAQHGGLYYSVAPDGSVCGSGKYSWVQAETIAAAAYLGSALGDDRYWSIYRQLWSYVLAHMVDTRLKCWHRNLTRDNVVYTDAVAMGRTDYHSFCACVDVSELLRRPRAPQSVPAGRSHGENPGMASLRIENLRKSYGDTAIVHDISCSIDEGEFIVIVGPSGCGKSTLLRTIAGLETVSAGQIYIDGRDVTGTPAAQRGIAMVFQSYALYPHMTVRENMSFGLKNLKRSKAEIKSRVEAAAQMLRLDDHLDRLPSQLSGGQRQRVAIGRAIVREPKIFLFDEPLSNLDAELRVQMRRELSKLHQRLGSTMIYVTHDQTEAMTLADRIILLNQGRIVQFGTPLDIYNRPSDTFAAGFIGSPKINLIEAQVQADAQGQVTVNSPLGAPFSLPRAQFGQLALPATVTLGMRPEHLRLAPQPGRAMVDLTVHMVEALGDSSCVYAALAGGTEFVLKLDGQAVPSAGTRCAAYIAPQDILLFDAGGQRIPAALH